jgi:Tfp pilus assembly protein PilF/GTP-binding protein EngB required for normal cell division
VGLFERLSQRLSSLVDDVALPDELRDRLDLAADLLESGNADAARQQLEPVVAARPESLRAWRLLGLAEWRLGHLDAAAAALERADDAPGLTALGDLRRERGDLGGATEMLRRALARDPSGPALADTLRALGEVYLAQGAADKALRELRKAAAARPRDGEVHALLGQAYMALAQPDRAREAFRRAIKLAETPSEVRPEWYVTLGELGLGVEKGADEQSTVEDAFGRAVDASDAGVRLRARVGLGRSRLARCDTAGAHEQALRALEIDGKSRPALELLAAVHEQGGNLAAAIGLREQIGEPALDAALKLQDRAAIARHAELALAADPNDPLARAAARVAAQPAMAPPTDLHALLRLVHLLCATRPELTHLLPEAAHAVAALDRPLLVAVMGEFNTGKSTFVNALVGEAIAPMGVLPTTATLNVFRYGTEAHARVVYRDERTREVAWADVSALLGQLSPTEARDIRMVELLYPSRALERVQIVDTPGLNSLIPEHEEVARGFFGEADALVWLFAAGQAGKQTEQEALTRAGLDHSRLVAVLNKIDRVDAADVAPLVAHLRAAFGADLAVVPVSAKQALVDGGGNFGELRATLESRFFARSRDIQRAAAKDRARTLLARARALVPTAPRPRQAERDALGRAARDFERDFIPAERTRVRAHVEDCVRAAARDVLEFAQPRSWVFGQNEAHPADRDFLLDVLEDAAAGVAAASRARVLVELGGGASLRLDAEVYGPLIAFARGYLRGGRVDSFFTRTLPRMALEDAPLRRELLAELPDFSEWLIEPLRRAAHEHFAVQISATHAADRADRAAALEAELELDAPLSALEHACQNLPA